MLYLLCGEKRFEHNEVKRGIVFFLPGSDIAALYRWLLFVIISLPSSTPNAKQGSEFNSLLPLLHYSHDSCCVAAASCRGCIPHVDAVAASHALLLMLPHTHGCRPWVYLGVSELGCPRHHSAHSSWRKESVSASERREIGRVWSCCRLRRIQI